MVSAVQGWDANQRYESKVWKGRLRDGWRRICGESTMLADLEEVAALVQARQVEAKRLEYVPLTMIVGSVGRTRDFTRDFLPRPCIDRERWAAIDAAVNAGVQFSPIDLYRIGDAYFVGDGHYRVSVARANGFLGIEAEVIELRSPVALKPEDFRRDAWRCKAKQQARSPQQREEHKEKVMLIDFQLARLIHEERLRKVEQERLYRELYGVERKPAKSIWLYVGDWLIAFGNRLKSNAGVQSRAAPLH
jgi:hypothetical protein